MKINDTRHLKAGAKFENVLAGEVYVDQYGNYVIATDDVYVVDLTTGNIYDVTFYTIEDEFTLVKARLEIE